MRGLRDWRVGLGRSGREGNERGSEWVGGKSVRICCFVEDLD